MSDVEVRYFVERRCVVKTYKKRRSQNEIFWVRESGNCETLANAIGELSNFRGNHARGTLFRIRRVTTETVAEGEQT